MFFEFLPGKKSIFFSSYSKYINENKKNFFAAAQRSHKLFRPSPLSISLSRSRSLSLSRFLSLSHTQSLDNNNTHAHTQKLPLKDNQFLLRHQNQQDFSPIDKQNRQRKTNDDDSPVHTISLFSVSLSLPSYLSLSLLPDEFGGGIAVVGRCQRIFWTSAARRKKISGQQSSGVAAAAARSRCICLFEAQERGYDE